MWPPPILPASIRLKDSVRNPFEYIQIYTPSLYRLTSGPALLARKLGSIRQNLSQQHVIIAITKL